MRFRRAEGIRYTLRACDREQLWVEVPHRGAQHALSRSAAAVLARLGQWRTADELGCAPAVLESLVARDLAYYSDGDEAPRHVLGCAPLPAREGPVALRSNLRLHLLILRNGAIETLPFMPRRGTLDGAELGGLMVRVLEHDEDVAAAALACCPRHVAALRALIPRLDGRHAWSGLAEGAAGDVLDLFDAVGLLEPAPPAPWPTAPAQVTWLGHAGVLYEAGGRRIVIDPFFHAPSQPPRRAAGEPPAAPPFDPRRLGPVDAIFVTHGDNDHLHAESLLRFDRHTPLYLPKAAHRREYQVDLEGVARVAGFDRVHRLDEWERVAVGDVQVVAAPFVGEDWGLELPKRTYLVTHPSLTVYLSADAAFMPDVYRRLAANHPRIDLACLGMAGCAEPLVSGPTFGYGHFYARWLPRERANQWIQHTATPAQSAEAAALLGARRVFGYAAGTHYMKMSFSDRGTREELAAEAAARAIAAVDLPLGVPTVLPP